MGHFLLFNYKSFTQTHAHTSRKQVTITTKEPTARLSRLEKDVLFARDRYINKQQNIYGCVDL